MNKYPTFSELSSHDKWVIVDLVLKFRRDWFSERKIVKMIFEEWVLISKTTVHTIISRDELEELEEDTSDSKIEYDDVNLYVFTKKIEANWCRVIVKHTVPFDILNRMQVAYVSKGKNRSQQEILNFNWWTEESPIYIKEKVWNAIKSTLGLQKLSWITNEIYAKIIFDKFWQEAVEEAIEEIAYNTTRERFREIEEKKLAKVLKVEQDRLIQRGYKMEFYLERLSEYVKEYTPEAIIKTTRVSKENHCYFVFWDLHTGRTTDQLEANVVYMVNYITNSWYKNVTLINVWDNLESPIVTWMHPSQVLDMDYRWFDQIIKAAQIIEKIMVTLTKNWINVELIWIPWNHDRSTARTEDDPERMFGLAVYEIVKSRIWNVTYFKDEVNTFIHGDFNFILWHWETPWFRKNPDSIALYWKALKYTIILSWHLHTPSISQWAWYTKVQVPSLNVADRYASKMLLLESLPWFAKLESVNNMPDVSFINCPC